METRKPEKQGPNNIGPGNPPESSKWKKGQSGNPKGRPKKDVCLTTLLKAEIEKVSPADKQGQTWMQLIVEATMRLAIGGNATALKEVWERIDVKVKEQFEIEGGLKVIRVPARSQDAEAWKNEWASNK